MRAWIRGLNLAGVGQRVFFGVPGNPTFPLIVVFRLGGGPIPGDTPIDRATFQLSLLGATPVAGRPPADKMALGSIATHLAGEIQSLKSGTVMAAGVVALEGAVDLGPVPMTDKIDGRFRYDIDATFKLKVA